ncbi:hypothetical protein D3C75_1306690 [compost metagenome]
MQTAALVPGRDMGEAMGCFKSEFFENFHGILDSEKVMPTASLSASAVRRVNSL